MSFIRQILLKVRLPLIALPLLFSANALANVELTFNQAANQVRADIELSSTVSLDFSIKFDNAIGLTPDNFQITAELLSLNDPSLLSRLPDSLLTTLPGTFPVLISVEPDPNKGFAFSGTANIELYTKTLHYTEGTPLRLFHSHGTEVFEDITTMTGSGSYRVRGTGGQFSDFIILADLRSAATVINEKVNRLDSFSQNVAGLLDVQVAGQLSSAVSAISSAVAQGNTNVALQEVTALIDVLEADNGTLYPDVWRSSADIINVRGRLLSMTRTLRFSLRTLP
ncbi:hypothetical protein CWE22_08810 [Pseudidiomarina aestuarii]|uniref:Uncharacterized protein n=1 Tax=Pseudidiomarina aestuarii TaxID=624146 RepID=A0A7Z6ZVV6_9GAMM|nr:DUF6689 family protein [Pseudidiomarina aestuarii]RUO42227.1 hypothetical protein CWE22_08810 [Pseudidiomarina aestuarii]